MSRAPWKELKPSWKRGQEDDWCLATAVRLHIARVASRLARLPRCAFVYVEQRSRRPENAPSKQWRAPLRWEKPTTLVLAYRLQLTTAWQKRFFQGIMADPRDKGLQDYRKKLLEHKEIDGRLKELREQLREQTKQYKKPENDLKALQSVGQIVGEILKQLTEEKFIVKATNGPRYVVGCRRQLDKAMLKPGTRVTLDMTTLTIMRYLPREVDPLVYNMSHEDPGSVSYSEIGGLAEQIRELREVIELPLTNPELFLRVGIIPPQGCLLYGPPGTGKTLLARAVASQLDCNFLKVVSSSIVDKYIGESARLI
ncbi:hypothetical protein J4Q44_G00225290 [Coregonus suidteri]|uniref:Uncharacterized protein n=1 Tax=Coregonus suidteri TaxID=861788 RepID=A0AAN8LSS6_9TELE